MKLSSLFNLVTDAQDVLDLFEGVKNTDQLRGRLRRVSNIEAEDLLTCLHSLQSSIARALDDTLYMNPDLDDPDWHFEDGQLAGIQSVRFALHGLTRDLGSDGPANQERALERDAAEGGEQNP